MTLSNDHKPYLPVEKERIEKAGGQVKFNRVNGDLAVSRALGDFVYKRCESVEAKEQAVTAFPEIIVEERDKDDEFIVLACDGIWDVMSSQEVVEKVGRAAPLRRTACNAPRAHVSLPPAPSPEFGSSRPPVKRGTSVLPPLRPCGWARLTAVRGPQVLDFLRNGRPAPAPEEDSGMGGEDSDEPKPPKPQRPWDLGAVCEALIDHCLRLGSRDKMSVIIVVLNPTLAPKAES